MKETVTITKQNGDRISVSLVSLQKIVERAREYYAKEDVHMHCVCLDLLCMLED